jgi:5'-deoxynucleotidase YfbR-like HD superfamily hydrolase
MPKPAHKHIDTLIRDLILPFHHIKRGTQLPIGERRWENDAEHSWSLAMLACSLAPEVDPTLDIGKISQFAIVHDLVEVYADDTSVFASAEELLSKSKREEAALQRIEREFTHFPWIAQTITAYEHKDTPEALFVYAVDKYIAIAYDHIDEGRLLREQKITRAQYNASLQAHRAKAHSHPAVIKYYDEVRDLLDSRPDYFYQK